MAKFIDRKAGSPHREPREPLDLKENGSLRRFGPGHRTASDFFSDEKQRQDVTRGELLNVLGMVEYNRQQARPWWRLWRWLTKVPQVTNVPKNLRDAHARQIAEIKDRLLREAEEMRAEVARRKADHSLDAPPAA